MIIFSMHQAGTEILYFLTCCRLGRFQDIDCEYTEAVLVEAVLTSSQSMF